MYFYSSNFTLFKVGKIGREIKTNYRVASKLKRIWKIEAYYSFMFFVYWLLIVRLWAFKIGFLIIVLSEV